MENFDSSLILENRLAAVMGGKMAVGGLRAGVEPFIEQLAAPTATPGGGSAAAASGAMAAGLAHMVASMSRGKKAYLQYESELSEAIARLVAVARRIESGDRCGCGVLQRGDEGLQSREGFGRWGCDDRCGLKAGDQCSAGSGQAAREKLAIWRISWVPITNPNMKSDLTTAIGSGRAAMEGGAGECGDQSRSR